VGVLVEQLLGADVELSGGEFDEVGEWLAETFFTG